MAAEWRPDPFGRAELRYFDGSAWTHHIATAGQQSMEPTDLPLAGAPDPSTFAAPAGSAAYPAWAAVPRRKGGRLIAAGILGIISGVLGLLASIGYFSLANLPNCADASPGQSCTSTVVDHSSFIKTLMGVSIAFTIGLIIAGIGGCMRRYWGQRTLIILGVVQVVFDVIIMIVKSSPASMINIVFCAVLIGLAQANNRSEYELPR